MPCLVRPEKKGREPGVWLMAGPASHPQYQRETRLGGFKLRTEKSLEPTSQYSKILIQKPIREF